MRLPTMVVLAASMIASVLGPGAAHADGDDALVWTDSGPVRGTVAQGYRVFQGIPYAAPPVDALRWRSPQPPQPWSQPRDATAPGPACAQGDGSRPGTSEDCLYLNVTTPIPSGRAKPVLVWLQGGGNNNGAGSDYDPHRLAVGGDVLVVTLNSRQGLLGYLAHPALPNSGNFGLEDQQAALRWVRRNAPAFGGDPSRVTLIGESWGSTDACALLTAPASQGLFQRLIVQSSVCSISWPVNGHLPGRPAGSPFVSRATAEATGLAVAAEYGCTDPATVVRCLYGLSAADLTRVDRGPTPMVYDTRVLPQRPPDAVAAGRFPRIPVLSGSNRDEGRLFAALWPQPIDYDRELHTSFGDAAERIENRYPLTDFDSSGLAWATVLTDHVWTCKQLTDDRMLARRTTVFTYQFADRNAPTGFFFFPPEVPSGAFHASELSYLFEWAGFVANRTPAQEMLANQMIAHWGAFAATGNPNGPGLPFWPRFDGSSAHTLAPGDTQLVNLNTQHNCAFWATIG